MGVLSPGEEFGTSNLTVRVEDGKLSNTVLYTENYGSRSSGRYRYGIQETLYNVGGTGGKLNVGGLISNSNLHNYYVNYETLVGRGGATLGLGISRMDYELGGAAQDFGANGVANTLSLFGSTPIYHMTDRKLKVTYGLDFRRMKDDYDRYSILDRKKHSEVAHVGVEGSERQPGSLLNYDATLYVGRHHNDSSSYGGKILDELSDTQGTFTKAVANVTGVQSLGHSADVMVKLQGQAASRNLDSSEQIYLGGANGVRAYPQGEGSGDKGFLGTAEFRFYTKLPGLVLSAYLDAGHVTGRGDGTLSGETLKGWGLGISYSKPNDWFARFDYARRIGSDPNMSSDARAKQRMWFILGKIW